MSLRRRARAGRDIYKIAPILARTNVARTNPIFQMKMQKRRPPEIKNSRPRLGNPRPLTNLREAIFQIGKLFIRTVRHDHPLDLETDDIDPGRGLLSGNAASSSHPLFGERRKISDLVVRCQREPIVTRLRRGNHSVITSTDDLRAEAFNGSPTNFITRKVSK
jgi:hypothetical protein